MDLRIDSRVAVLLDVLQFLAVHLNIIEEDIMIETVTSSTTMIVMRLVMRLEKEGSPTKDTLNTSLKRAEPDLESIRKWAYLLAIESTSCCHSLVY